MRRRVWAWGVLGAMLVGGIANGATTKEQAMRDAMTAPREGVDYVVVPAEGPIAGAEAWVREHPDDAGAFYDLGRLHAMAWEPGGKAYLARAPKDGEMPALPSFESPMNWKMKRALDPGADKHMTASIAALRRAVELKPDVARHQMALAVMLMLVDDTPLELPDVSGKQTGESLQRFNAMALKLGDPSAEVRTAADNALRAALPGDADFLRTSKPANSEAAARVTDILRSYCDMEAMAHFRRAFALAVDEDLKVKDFGNNEAISYWAAGEIRDLLVKYPDKAEPGEVQKLTELQDKLVKVPGVIKART